MTLEFMSIKPKLIYLKQSVLKTLYTNNNNL